MILKVHLLSGKTGLSCKIIYLLHLVFIYHSTCSSCSPAVSDNGSGICLDNCHETVAFCIWWTKRLSRAYLLGSLRLIIHPIMVSNFPFSLIEMIRYTKRLDEDWNHSGSHYLFIYILFFFSAIHRQHKPKDVGTYSYSMSSCNSLHGSGPIAFLLERRTLHLKSNNFKTVQIARYFTESCS